MSAGGGAVATPVGFPLLTDWYGTRSRARVFAYIGMAGGIGSVAGPAIAGVLGDSLGWRATMITLGLLATVVSFITLRLTEPRRGAQERSQLPPALAELEPRPVTWAEGWRAAASIGTLRRLWWAMPVLVLGGAGVGQFTNFFYREVYGLGSFSRGWIVAGMAGVSLVGLAVSGPIADRLIATDPARIVTLMGGLLVLNALSVVGLAFAPVLWMALLVQLPLGVGFAMLGPATQALASLIVPARLRAFGMQTVVLFGAFGLALNPFIFYLADRFGFRVGLVCMAPIYVLGGAIVASTATLVPADIRRAQAALAAEAEAAADRGGAESDLAPPVLVCRDVHVTIGNAELLSEIDMVVRAGEIVALVGTNGAGKSTLLAALAGRQPATGGAVFLDGDDVTSRPPHDLARKGVATVDGGRAVIGELTVADHLRLHGIALPAAPSGVPAPGAPAAPAPGAPAVAPADRLLARLAHRLDTPAGDLSGGEQQTLAVAIAVADDPLLLLVDEMTLGLSPAAVEDVLGAVRACADAGTAVVVVEQSIDLAASFADRAVFLDKGRVQFDGPAAELLSRAELLGATMLSPSAVGGTGARRSTGDGTDAAALAVDQVTLRYGGVVALDDVTLRVAPGEIVGLIGPNGAGKTSLVDVVSGAVRPDAGTVSLAGSDVTDTAVHARARAGLARSFQHARLVPELSAIENVQLFLERHLDDRLAITRAVGAPSASKAERRAEARAFELLERFQLDDIAGRRLRSLSTGQRHVVELACLLALRPSVLLLDEPSAGLSQAETEALRPLLRTLATERACGVLLVEHDLGWIERTADRLVCLVAGAVVADGPPSEVLADPVVRAAYLPTTDATPGAPT